MYNSLSIERFRGIAQLEIPKLHRLNLFLGMNNAGKTSVLEALFLLGGATTPTVATKLAELRGQRIAAATVDAVLRPLFFGLEPEQTIELSASWNRETHSRWLQIKARPVSSFSEPRGTGIGAGSGVASVTEEFIVGGLDLRYRNGSNREVAPIVLYDAKIGYASSSNLEDLRVERENVIRTTFLSARSYSSLDTDVQQFSHLLRIKQEAEVVKALTIVEPRLKRIEVLSEMGGSSVYVDIGLPTLIPLSSCGEGFVRLFSIVVEVIASKGGVLLIDEIDNGLHYSVMLELWSLLSKLIELHDVQIFATTHNDEMIRLALEAFEHDLSILGLHRIDRHGDQHQCVSYDHEALSAVLEQNFETRGG